MKFFNTALTIRERTLSMLEGGRAFYKLFKKYFVTQGTTELFISRSSNFFDKNYVLQLKQIYSKSEVRIYHLKGNLKRILIHSNFKILN